MHAFKSPKTNIAVHSKEISMPLFAQKCTLKK